MAEVEVRLMLVAEAVRGLSVQSVEPGSAMERLGVRGGDRLLAIDGLVPRDVIDLQLELAAGQARTLTVERSDGQRLEVRAEGRAVDAAALTLVEAVPGGIRECNNHCEFCFIRGLPQGLRRSLYVFDDDYRYSFLWGNFLTLTNLTEADWARIGYQRLSPLNVSVHATDPAIRRTLLNNRHAPEILPQLRRLGELGIEVNAQIVLCARMNDGAVLDQTIADLSELYPTVQSVSVVPVGLTRYSRVKNIRRPTPAEAAMALEQCERYQDLLRKRLGVDFVYGSDELYLLSGRAELPAAKAYDGFPVLSNGVGLLRSMLDEWNRLLERLPRDVPAAHGDHANMPAPRGDRASMPAAHGEHASMPAARGERANTPPPRNERANLPPLERERANLPPARGEHANTPAAPRERVRANVPPGRKVAWLTGGLAAPALERMADSWYARMGWRPAVVIVENTFFGEGVSVSGLLSGRDLIDALHKLPADMHDVVLPSGPFGFDGRSTLDGISADEVGAAHPGRVHLVSSPRELLAILQREA